MPAVVGPIQLVKITPSGVAGFGDRAFISPKSSIKNIVGAGTYSTGNYISVDNQVDMTTTFDTSVFNQPTVRNN